MLLKEAPAIDKRKPSHGGRKVHRLDALKRFTLCGLDTWGWSGYPMKGKVTCRDCQFLMRQP